MLRPDNIFFDAISSSTDLMKAVGGRVKSTCFEVAPDKKDNTDLPYIVIRDEGQKPSTTCKDDGWMPMRWSFAVGIEVGGKSKNEVDSIIYMAMQAIAEHIEAMADNGQVVPYLDEDFPQTQGVAWDWTKPCYFDIIHYQVEMEWKRNT